MKIYDFIIIGGGAGAFAAAIHAGGMRAKTALINDGLPLGGTCVNVGCIPTKRLLWAAEILHTAKNRHIPGIRTGVEQFDFKVLIENELDLVSRLREEKYYRVLHGLETVTHYTGKAKFVSENAVQVNGEILSAGKMLIAAGSTANVAPIAGIEKTGCVTHVEALALERLPGELLIIGAGPAGIEFAQMFARFGSKVTVLKRSPGILRFAENELTRRLQQVLQTEGIKFITCDEILKAERIGGKKVLSIAVDGEKSTVSGDEILMAAGKTPNTGDLDLHSASVAMNDRQAIVVNEFFQTSNPGIYAAGDVADLPARYETTAGREGTLAAQNALSGARGRINYDQVPFTIFTDPQLAGIGLTETEQMRRTGVCRCRTVELKNLPRAIIMDRTEGLIKMTVDPSSGRILGVHILAPHAGELIAAAMYILRNNNTIDDVINSLPMFPTLAEALKWAALSFKTDISRLSCCV